MYLTLPQLDKPIYMTHRPLDCKKDCFNLFGHIYEKCMVKEFGLNVGVDCNNFWPADVETFLFRKNAIENHYDRDVFCGINELKKSVKDDEKEDL